MTSRPKLELRTLNGSLAATRSSAVRRAARLCASTLKPGVLYSVTTVGRSKSTISCVTAAVCATWRALSEAEIA